eukprot:g12102.t1
MTLSLRQTVSTAALLTAALVLMPAQGQVQVQNGSAHDANQQVGSGGYNQAGRQVDYRARNLLVTGNVAGGRAFQGSVGYTAAGSFQGSLGSDSLFNFRRDSVFSSANAGGFNYRASQVGDRVVVTRPSDNLTGYRVSDGNGLSTRTAYDPRSGVVTFRQAGGGLVAVSGFDSPDSLRNTGSSLGLVRTPTGFVSVDASPLTGIRYNPLDAAAPAQTRPNTDLPEVPNRTNDPKDDEQADPDLNDPTAFSDALRIDGQYQPDLTQDALAQRQLRQDPLAISLGTQVQSQMAQQLAGQEPLQGNTPDAQAMSLRERVFGKGAIAQDTNQPPKAPENPYDKLLADILARAEGNAPEREQSDEPAEDNRPEWQKIFDEPEQAVLDAKLQAREAAMRIALGLVDEEGNIDYETELPTIDADSQLGQLLDDLSYDLPRVQTLAGEDANRINKLMSRGEQELKDGRYIVAESIYRQILREKGKDPLAKAGLIHSQMGAGMIRSAALNLRGLFADHPELIALRYDDNLLPETERLRWLQNRLQKMIGEDIHGAAPGLVLAYLGYQLEAKPLIEYGLNVAESEAPRDPLMPVVRKIWLQADVPRDLLNTPALQPGTSEQLSLTDFIDPDTLQELQDSFTSFARLSMRVLDNEGNPVTRPTDLPKRAEADQTFEHLTVAEREADGSLRAPISIGGHELGSIHVTPHQIEPDHGLNAEERERLISLCNKFGLTDTQQDDLLTAAEFAYTATTGASLGFMHQIANSIASLCYEQHQNRQRIRELRVLYELSTLLSAQANPQETLDAAANAIARVMAVKAVVIRLLTTGDDGKPELEARALFGMDPAIADKGKTLVNKSELTRKALTGEMVYIEDMTTDPRSYYPDDARRAEITSMLSTGLMVQDKGIGTIQLFTEKPRRFTMFEENLIRAIAQLLATAVRSAQLDAERQRSKALARQVELAQGVQQRMLPKRSPKIDGIDIAATYVPSQGLGGDFYDFISLDNATGIAVGDAVGKGVAASLLMASVRSSLRAYAHDLYDLDVILSRVNQALDRDTLDNEFATLWYGTIDHESKRLTYCNAGHEPALLLRDNKVIPLDIGGMVTGVLADAKYEKGVIDLESGDLVVLYSDGVTDAMNEHNQRFGREKLEYALQEVLPSSAEQGVDALVQRLADHRGDREANDDITVVLVKVD